MFRKFIFLVVFINVSSYSQSNWQKFKKLSPSKKVWVLFHPFKAKRAQIISTEANRVSDSIKSSPLLDGDASGGQVDAFRHTFWMASLRQGIGKSAARSLGRAHEKENYRTYKKSKLEDGVVPDKIASTMDLFNNEIGLSIGKNNNKTSTKKLIYKIINAIQAGELKVIKKDSKGNFISCEGKLLSKESLKRKWENKKCLVNSNYKK